MNSLHHQFPLSFEYSVDKTLNSQSATLLLFFYLGTGKLSEQGAEKSWKVPGLQRTDRSEEGNSFPNRPFT